MGQCFMDIWNSVYHGCIGGNVCHGHVGVMCHGHMGQYVSWLYGDSVYHGVVCIMDIWSSVYHGHIGQCVSWI